MTSGVFFPPELEKARIIAALQKDPWNKEALISMSQMEFGDRSRLYRMDAIKSDIDDLNLASDFVRWEINEEFMGSKKIDVFRLSKRIQDILNVVFISNDRDVVGISVFLAGIIGSLNDENKTKQTIITLKSIMLLEDSIPGIIREILALNTLCTREVLADFLKGRIATSIEFQQKLIIAISSNKYLFADLEIRRLVTKKIYQLGDYDLAFWMGMKSVEVNPQDNVSAHIALEAAIKVGDDDRILQAGGLSLTMKKEQNGIKYNKIAESAIRKNRAGYAKDLLTRRRMRLDLEGHRLRLGLFFQEKDWNGVKDEYARTPKPFSEHDSLKTYVALSEVEDKKLTEAGKSIAKIKDGIEQDLLKYYQRHSNGDFYGAMWALNSHFSKNGMAIIDEEWGRNDCSFMSLTSSNLPQKKRDRGKVSVIMTCHRFNEALPLALQSIAQQDYPNVELIFVDDHSPKKDVQIYDNLLEGMNVKRIRMGENSGTYACRNAGIEVADGDFVTFADSDDWIHPEKISNSLEVMISTNSELVVGRYIRMAHDGRIQWNGVRFARFALMGMTFRASSLKAIIRGFDGRMRHSADSEIFERARILLGDRKVVRYPNIEVIALESGTNLTSKGSLAIDWMGVAGERVRYAGEFRSWHRNLKYMQVPKNLSFPSVVAGYITDEVKEIRKSFGYQDFMGVELPKKIDIEEEKGEGGAREQILVTMCTYEGGFQTVGKAITSLLFYQTTPISKLKLTVNGNKIPEDLPEDDRLEIILSEEDVTDRGKFIQIEQHQGFVITADDDISYPSDYVETMIGHVERYGRAALIGVHGAHIPEGPPITRWWEYMNYRRSIVFHQEIPDYMPVNVIGTGTLAFHTSIGVPDPTNFDYQRMVDLHLAVWAQEMEIPMLVCPRRRDWLEEINAGYVGRIWDTAKEDAALQHKMLEVLQRTRKWTLHSERECGRFSYSGIMEVFGAWKNRELCPGMELPPIEQTWAKLGPKPLVTIYMPCFNCESYVVESIESALNQSYKKIEICVHDDGSTDNTLKIIKKKYRFNRKVKISSGKNGGIGHASNSSINNGSGELILQLDSDDILHPRAIEKLLPMMEKNTVCAYGSFIRINPDGKKIDDGWDWPIYTRPRLLRSMIVHHPRLFRRDAWEHIGGFDESLENAVDYDFFLRLSELGGMEHLGEKLYSYRIHQASTSQDKVDIQTKNTYIVQRAALERMELGDFTNFAPNPDFPRRIHYTYPAFLNREVAI